MRNIISFILIVVLFIGGCVLPYRITRFGNKTKRAKLNWQERNKIDRLQFRKPAQGKNQLSIRAEGVAAANKIIGDSGIPITESARFKGR